MTDGTFFGRLGDGSTAASAAELRSILDTLDVTVPRRTDGRRSEHRERYCIIHYLRALEQNGLLCYPITIAKGLRLHAYFDVNLNLVWDTVTDDLPPLIAELETLLEPGEPQS